MLSFDNGFARNVVIFGVDNIWSSHTDNQKNNFLVLVEGSTDINDQMILILTLVMQRQMMIVYITMMISVTCM